MKINKIIIGFITTFLLCFSLNALAGPDLSSIRASKQGANASPKAARAASFKTDVHVLNSSSQQITVRVPGTSINDTLYPNEIEDIYSDIYFDSIQVVLYDRDGYEFFRDYIPNHATVVVDEQYTARSAEGGKQRAKLQAHIKNQ